MTTSHLPRTKAERLEIVAAVDPIVAAPPSWISTTVLDAYRVAAQELLTARNEHDAATGRAATDRERERAAGEAADQAFRRWYPTVRDAAGKARIDVYGVELGYRSPSLFLTQSARTRLEGWTSLLVNASQRADLLGDAVLLAALGTAVAAWTPSLVASEAAERAKITAGDRLQEANAAFDRSYRPLVRVALATDPGGVGARLPVFYRAKRAPPAQPPPAT